MSIPNKLNPFGKSGKIIYRNFYDSAITWTDFNALNFSNYSSIRIQIDFTIPNTYRGNSNMPIFGVVGGNTCPLFLSRNSNNSGLIYTYQSSGRYIFLSNYINFSSGQHKLVYTMTPNNTNSLVLDNSEKITTANIFSGYPGIGNNVSQADCTIQRLEVYGNNTLIWQATKAELTIRVA